MEHNTIHSILFVDDESNILSSLKRLFKPLGYEIYTASGGAEGLDVLSRHAIDVVVSDMRMPEMDGAKFLSQARENWPDTVRILLTGYADINATISAVNKGNIYRYISKPWEDNDPKLFATGSQAASLRAILVQPVVRHFKGLLKQHVA